MPWTPWTGPTFTEGVVWKNLPDKTTPVNALNLNTEENAEATYAAQVGQSVFDSITGQLPDPASILANGRAAGGALAANATRTSTIDVPVLRDFVSVMDAPFNAKGDAKQAVTGNITAGANTLTGVPAITSTDTGKPIVVATAGPNVVQGGAGPTVQGPLKAFIGTVSGGNVSLVTTSGGSTPANATFTVTNATVRWGTNDTAAWNSAMVAVSAQGTAQGTPAVLFAPSGSAFMLDATVPKNNVTIWAYGATFYSMMVTAKPMFNAYFTQMIGFSIRGANFPGIYAETQEQQVFGTTEGSIASPLSTDLGFFDCIVTNWSTGIFYMMNVVRARAIGNRMSNVCSLNGYNAINFVVGSLSTNDGTREIIATHNVIEGCGTEALTMVNTASAGTSYATNTVQVRAIFTNNICESPLGSAPPLELEFSLGLVGHQSKFIIANNHATYSGPSTANACALNINDASTATPTQPMMTGAGNPDPEFLNRVIVAGNVCESSCIGMQIGCSEATVYGNVVNTTGNNGWGLRVGKLSSAMSFVGDLTSGSATVSNITSANPNIVNGNPITGTNIASGTYLLSGAGTTTYTLSIPATGTATAQTTSIVAQNKNVVIAHNVIHVSNAINQAGQNPFDLANLRDSTIIGNRVICDPGTANNVMYGLRIFRCGWLEISHNRIDYAPQYGVYIDSTNDWTFSHNRIYNPSTAAAGWSGLAITNMSPNILARVESNVIVDDRAVHLMTYGLNIGSTAYPVIEALNNEIHGYTSGSHNGPAALKLARGNVTDTWTTDAMVVTASNAALPLPPCTQLRITTVGAGAGGGGGGSAGGASPVTSQVGGAGGSSGPNSMMIVPSGSNLTLNCVVGLGGAGGAGGAAGTGTAGSAGTQGSSGNATTVTGTGISVGSDGAQRGLGGAANSTVAVNGVSGAGGNTAISGTLMTGGSATSTGGLGGGFGMDYSVSGGSGGGPSTATNGGGGGPVSATGRAGVSGAVGGSATAAGGNGANATGIGGGGGGGGGGSWNGGTSGAGGNGGNGHDGAVIIEVMG